jgi:hypothetical protein
LSICPVHFGLVVKLYIMEEALSEIVHLIGHKGEKEMGVPESPLRECPQ